MTSDNVEIVASFPFPPKKYYEHLSVEQIVSMKPPEPPNPKTDDSITIFGNEQVIFTITSKQSKN